MRRCTYLLLLFQILAFGACHPPFRPTLVQVAGVQLSKPVVWTDSVFFYDTAQVFVTPPLPDCQVHFTTDGSSPQWNSPVVEDKLTVRESTTLKFKTMGGGFVASEEVSLRLFKIPQHDKSIREASAATAPYDQATAELLIDHQKASKNFKDGAWLGYQLDNVIFELQLPQAPVKGVVLSFLEDQGSWIFAPASVTVSFYDESGKLITQLHRNYAADTEKEGSAFQFINIATPEILPTKLKLEIKNLSAIPAWHPGNGKRPWLFLDEIIVL